MSDTEHDWVAALLAADRVGPMPSGVSDRVVAALRGTAVSGQQATETVPRVLTSPPLGGPAMRTANPMPTGSALPTVGALPTASPMPTGSASPTVGGGQRRDQRNEDASDRRHFLLWRIAPVAAAMIVVAGASAVVATQLRPEQQQVASSAAEAVDPGVAPNGLVASGTQYTSADLAAQAQALLTAVTQGDARSLSAAADDVGGGGLASAAAPEAAGTDESAGTQDGASAVPDPLLNSPLVSAAAYQQCAQTLGAPEGVLPTAIDLAVFDGTEAAIVVLQNRAGDGFEVIVTDRLCNPDTERASTSFVGP